MERLKLRRWLDAELVGEPPSGPAEGIEGVRLTTTDRRVRSSADPKPARGPGPAREAPRAPGSPRPGHPGSGAGRRAPPQRSCRPLGSVRAFCTRGVHVVELVERAPPNATQRTSVRRHGGVVLAGRRRPPGRRHVVVEADHVELDVLELQAVPRRPAGDDLRPERVPHAMDVASQRLRRRRRTARGHTASRSASSDTVLPTASARRASTTRSFGARPTTTSSRLTSSGPTTRTSTRDTLRNSNLHPASRPPRFDRIDRRAPWPGARYAAHRPTAVEVMSTPDDDVSSDISRIRDPRRSHPSSRPERHCVDATDCADRHLAPTCRTERGVRSRRRENGRADSATRPNDESARGSHRTRSGSPGRSSPSSSSCLDVGGRVRRVLGPLGIFLTVIVIIRFGNPSSGGAKGVPCLPAFWKDLGPFLPPPTPPCSCATRSTSTEAISGSTRRTLVGGLGFCGWGR